MKGDKGDGLLDVWIALCKPCLMPASISHCVDINLQHATMPEDTAMSPPGISVYTKFPCSQHFTYRHSKAEAAPKCHHRKSNVKQHAAVGQRHESFIQTAAAGQMISKDVHLILRGMPPMLTSFSLTSLLCTSSISRKVELFASTFRLSRWLHGKAHSSALEGIVIEIS